MEMAAAQPLLLILTFADAGFRPAFASPRQRFVMLSINTPRALLLRRVNTSLSGTLFFSMCWCIRDVVHFDSRVHAAIKPSHYIRRATWPRKLRRQRSPARSPRRSKSRLKKIAGGLMPARHESLQDDLLLEANFR